MGWLFAIVAVIFVLFVKPRYERYKEQKTLEDPDYYAFGLPSAIATKRAVENKQYAKAEQLIAELNSDDLTQTIDCLSLSMNEQIFLDWIQASQQKQIPKLFLGVHYNHQAWRARGHSYAEDVSYEGALGFFEYQDQSVEQLLEIENDPRYGEEICCRLMRNYMGMSQLPKVHEYFDKTIERNRDNLWAYVRYAEAVQPKWGGNQTLINRLLDALPERKLIVYCTKLKLLVDGLNEEKNYFSVPEEDIKARASSTVMKIDKEISANPIQSIHRYMLYGYMAIASSMLDLDLYFEKYEKKMNNYYALYPYGIQ